MYVKRLQQEDLKQALELVWEVFLEEVAPLYTEQGVATFQQFINYDMMLPKMMNGSMNFFGAYEGDSLCGVSAVRFDGHISLLFVGKQWRRRGAAKMLMKAMLYYCVELRHLPRITVNSAPNAREVYEHFGFRALGPEREEHGIRFIPMEHILVTAPQKNNQKQVPKKDAMIRSVIMVVCMYILFNTFFTFMNYSSGDATADKGIFSGMLEADGEKESVKEEDKLKGEGLQALEEYAEPNLSYTITEEKYELKEEGIDFKVSYPQLVSEDGTSYEHINQVLENCAMSTVNVLHKDTSKEVEELLGKKKNKTLQSEVTYRVTYAGKDKISVVFNDEYIAGDERFNYIDLRTRTINLENGKVYELKDMIDLSNEFALELKRKAKEINKDSFIANKCGLTMLKRVLMEKVVDGSYYNVFYLTENGMDVGMTYHYTDIEEAALLNGWETVRFSSDELQKYRVEDKK